MKFTDKIANYILENELPLNHLTIVLPSERAKKYLATSLFNAFQRPVFAPKMITIDHWVKSHSDKVVIDKTRVLIELFNIQLVQAKTEEDRSFDEFITWGNILIADFNEIDRYLLDAKDVFRNLADIKEIEQWSFNSEENNQPLSEGQKRFMEFWDRLPGYYHALNKALDKKKCSYAGGAFNYLANNVDVLFQQDKESVFLFAGFNALSKAELTIIRQLEKLGRAHVLVDADAYYLDNKQHEAGKFLRELSISLDGKKWEGIENNLATKELKIEMIECAQNTGQVKAAATILEASSKEEINQTLLLLADESLIGSVIKNLPRKIEKANITLGLPIRNTALRTWIDLLFSIQENKTRFNTSSIYFSDLQAFWSHPFLLATLNEEEKRKLISIESDIIRHNRIFLNPTKLDLGEDVSKLLEKITQPWNNQWSEVLTTIRSLNIHFYERFAEMYAFEKAVIECFDRSLVDFQNLIDEGIPEMSLKSFKLLFNQHWGTKSIAYHGNPLDGLQIMGLLETRALDFKRIICIGMNEGKLPPTNPIQTMIPMDLRRYLGLPTPREKQGLFAHHFYRLLHQCEELFVTYSTATEAIGSNEPSRYLMQLEMELSRVNPNVKIKKSIYSLDAQREVQHKEIPKTEEIKLRLDELFAQSASASMFKKFIECPLDFYFRYVMEFGEQDEVEEEIEHTTFGTFIHATLEELYTPFARFDKDGVKVTPAPSNITSWDVEAMLKHYKLVLHRKFKEHFNGDEDAFMKGKNLLSYKMADTLTKQFLTSEIDFLAHQTELVFIEALERKYETDIEVEVFGETKKVHLVGHIDRIDSIGDRVRIIDYKSGKVADVDVQLRKLDKAIEDTVTSLKNRKHTLQLMYYAFLYQQAHGVIAESSIISFISNKNQPFTLEPTRVELKELLKEFPVYLGQLMEEIYDAEVPFRHDGGKMFSYCQYCD